MKSFNQHITIYQKEAGGHGALLVDRDLFRNVTKVTESSRKRINLLISKRNIKTVATLNSSGSVTVGIWREVQG
ncbi:MAG: hypothetical protein LUQ37_09980 [Methanoregulaceae archaeon]|jgi:hypothetical protein|nr:hypothetical protein [Methanoregulaceae archaeon]